MWNRVKSGAKWVYNWITVLAASLIGAPALLLDFLAHADAINWSFAGQDTALSIVTGIGIAKAILTMIVAYTKKPA